MYLFVHNICFYSNLFGFETKKIIPFQEITSVKRAKTAAIFPTAIEIIAAGKKYFFTSFLSRDEAFKLIKDGWSEHGNGENAILDQQDSRSELNDQESDVVIVEKSNGSKQLAEELEFPNRNKGDSVSEDSDPSPSGEAEVLLTSPGVQDIVDDETVVVPNTDCSSSGKSLVWELEDSDAPDVPEYYTLTAESKFPIKVEEFFNLFFSNEAVHFVESYHEKCGDKDLKCTSWKPHEKYGHAREVSFQHPIKIYFGARFGSCNEVQKYRVYRNSHLVVNTSQEINDVPYGDYFCVEGLWDVEADGVEGCRLRVYVNVAFSKKTMWKGKIVQATVEECRDTFAIFIELAHDLLKQKNIEKEARGHQANTIQNGEVHEEAQENTVEHSERPQEEYEPTTSEALPDFKDCILVNTPSQGCLRRTGAVACSLRDYMAKPFSSLKFQSQVPSFVVVVLAVVILLLQISIVVLLLRPQQVQVISESDWMGSTRNERRVETMALLDKQVSNLKEEMLMVETLLEKMRHEHEVLTVQLKKLLVNK